jgi:4-amino-4-deoxy-L-arabinose transferase-like glycosyltransferase
MHNHFPSAVFSYISKLFSQLALKPWQLLLLSFIGAYGINLFIPRDLWVQDEMRYGEVVREMLNSGNWLVMHLNGYTYPDKPALYFWLVALMGKLVGHGEFAFRLLTFISTLIAGWGLYQLGSRLLGKQGGFLACLLFGSSLLTLIVGHIARMDMLLTASTVWAWLHLLEFDRTDSRHHLVYYWAICALSVAIKGPIALLFTLLPGIFWQIQIHSAKGILRLRPWYGLFVMVAMVSAWIIAVIQSGSGDYLAQIWHQQLVGRTINSWSHKQPIYFYWVLLPILSMPWAVPIYRGLKQLWSESESGLRSILFFALVPLIGISLVSGKLFIYLLPLIPALCLSGAFALGKLASQQKVSAWLAWPPAVFNIAIAVLLYVVSKRYLSDNIHLGIVLSFGVVLLACVQIYAVRLSFKRWFFATCACMIVFSCLVFGGMVTLLNPLFSARHLALTINSLATPAQDVAVVNVTRGILNYYAKRTFVELDVGQASAWASQHLDAILIIKTSDIPAAFGNTNISQRCEVILPFNVELKDYYVLAKCKP